MTATKPVPISWKPFHYLGPADGGARVTLIAPGHTMQVPQERADETVLAAPCLRHRNTVVENCKIDCAAVARGNGANQGTGAVVAERARLTQYVTRFARTIQPVPERSVVDSGNGQDVKQGMSGSSELLLQ